MSPTLGFVGFVGFVGIGLMGEAMTRRLLDRGWQVTVWNLEPERLDLVWAAVTPTISPAQPPCSPTSVPT